MALLRLIQSIESVCPKQLFRMRIALENLIYSGEIVHPHRIDIDLL